jgi:outer membrane protein OmpU
MNNSTRNLKMKKLLIASTALVAAAGMASADITISGHAAAGIYSGLGNKDGVAKNVAGTTSKDYTAISTAGTVTHYADSKTAHGATTDVALTGTNGVAAGTAAVAETFSGDGIYSNAGVDFTMTGATDNGISFSASVNIDAGMEVDTGDFELDGKDGGTAGLGSVSMSGAFGTLTFDDGGIENLYSDGLTNADVSYATTIGAVSLTVAHDTAAATGSANSVSAGYSASGMDFTFTASEATGGTSNSLAVSYALNDTVTLTGETDQAATKESVQTIGATTTLNGVSVAVSSANNSTWDVDLGYTAGGFALTYGVDETDGWTATATSALGGGATFAAGVDSNDSMYAGVSFAF